MFDGKCKRWTTRAAVPALLSVAAMAGLHRANAQAIGPLKFGVLATIPGNEAFKSQEEGGCPLLNSK